jgi:hemerythrin-like domain-containing protein
MDAVQLIQRDHREVEKLFEEFERAEHAGEPGRAAAVARALVRELSVHAAVEEQFVYPALREQTGDRPVLDALEEHHGAKVTLDEIDALPPGARRLASKVRVLAASVRRHVEEEERHLLPALARALDARQLRELGETLARAKEAAPTRPHPASPDTPPGNLVVAPLAAIVDRCLDALRDGARLLGTLLALAAQSGVEGTRRAARRARGSLHAAAERGREAAEGVREKGREAADEVRAAADRVEVRGAAAARELRRSGRAARHGAAAAGRAARGAGRRSRRSRSRAR